MTVVASAGADAFLKRLPPGTRAFLVHGYDEGLIHERTRAIVDALLKGDRDPMRLARMDGDAVARDPGALLDEALAISMFGGDKVIWIEASSRDVAAAVGPLLNDPPANCSLVIAAGALKKGTALRTMFEKSDRAASIECYADDQRSLGALIDAEAREAGQSIAGDARDALVALLGADRMATRSEIAKLLLYTQGKRAIGLSDVQAIVADATPDATDDVVDSSFIGDSAAIETAAGRFFSEGGDAGSLMAMLVRRAILLHRVRLGMDAGARFDAVVQGLYVRLPPVRKANLERQAARWSSGKLVRMLPLLQRAAARARRDARLAQITATRTLWALASSARAGAA